ncbi:MAG: MnhB domain-containing protein [Ilumatobacter sp.]|uniref:MnhB domain-containing protein n=1 Tax=Ilumatobacter sp. TaxID=1967498 RepID=UPI00261127DE|nr:MnhB domain-containing protein [Ilumatobacter sp.]MDJ0769780.1 MnhB domain-containing protein [Ilumatobacter sp.]
MREYYDDRIVALSARLVTPFIQLFALYVVFHGHYSPGGGFQGGAMLAASFLLIRLSIGTAAAQSQFQRSWGMPVSSIGILVFLGTGLIVMFLGFNFLDHAGLPFGLPDPELRNAGILAIELGVAIAVTATLISIYDDLVGEPRGPLAGLDEATEVAEADQVEGAESDAESGDG